MGKEGKKSGRVKYAASFKGVFLALKKIKQFTGYKNSGLETALLNYLVSQRYVGQCFGFL